jgi:putative ABC transport system permease protein
MALGYVFLKLVTNFLNLDIRLFFLPPSVLLMEVASALIIPIVAALIPIVQGTKRSVRDAISEYQSESRVGRVDKLLARITGVSLPTLISLRNVFRKRGRLALTLGTLVTAGALFMGVINVRTGMFKEMDRILAMFDFEVSINLTEDSAVTGLVKRIEEVDGVTAVEARTHAAARRIKSDGTKGSQFGITGLPPETIFSHPVLLNGRWLMVGDKDKIVLSSAFIRDNPDLSPGEALEVEVGGERYRLEVVGVIAMTENETFSDFASVARIKDEPNLASGYLIKTTPNDAATQDSVAAEVEDRLERSGVRVASKQTKNEIYASAANQFNFLIFFLLTMAVMVAIVGGLGLAGTMSLNVMERTREIGIMRSIGASDAVVRKVVLLEGLLVGFISWLAAVPLSFPLTFGFCYLLGNAFFNRTLVFAMVPGGMVIWLIIVMVIAVAASLLPAGRASKMSISETLSYE